MLTGAQFIANCLSFRGEPYGLGAGRTSPTSGYKDCSGLGCAALLRGGVIPCGTVSTTMETCSCGGRCWTVAKCIDRATAQRTPGAAAAIWGLGSNGHIGYSMGDGRIVETPSAEGRRVGISPWDRNRWTEYFLLAGIDYSGAASVEEDTMKGFFAGKAGDNRVWYVYGNSKSWVTSPTVLAPLAFAGHAIDAGIRIVDAAFLDALPVVPSPAATSGGAPPPPAQVDLTAVAKAVNDDAARRLAS